MNTDDTNIVYEMFLRGLLSNECQVFEASSDTVFIFKSFDEFEPLDEYMNYEPDNLFLPQAARQSATAQLKPPLSRSCTQSIVHDLP